MIFRYGESVGFFNGIDISGRNAHVAAFKAFGPADHYRVADFMSSCVHFNVAQVFSIWIRNTFHELKGSTEAF